MSEVQVSAAALAAVRGELSSGRSGLEGVAASAPASVDAGEMTAMILGMLGRVVDNAAAVSDGVAAVSAEVNVVEATYWDVDTDVAARYQGPQPPR